MPQRTFPRWNSLHAINRPDGVEDNVARRVKRRNCARLAHNGPAARQSGHFCRAGRTLSAPGGRFSSVVLAAVCFIPFPAGVGCGGVARSGGESLETACVGWRLRPSGMSRTGHVGRSSPRFCLPRRRRAGCSPWLDPFPHPCRQRPIAPVMISKPRCHSGTTSNSPGDRSVRWSGPSPGNTLRDRARLWLVLFSESADAFSKTHNSKAFTARERLRLRNRPRCNDAS